MSPGCAACCSRAATLTVSPVASRSSVPVTTSPLQTPIRPSIPSAGSARQPLRRRSERAGGVVFVHGREPEDRHHRVADELLHDATVPHDDRLHALEVTRQERAERLRVERFAERGRPGDVAEEHRHDLGLLALAPAYSRAALRTEPEGAGIFESADGALGHAESLGPCGPSNKSTQPDPAKL